MATIQPQSTIPGKPVFIVAASILAAWIIAVATLLGWWMTTPSPAEGQVKLPGFGYVPPPNSCACLWRDSSAGGHGGGLDCWLIDQTAIPFFDQFPFPTPASYTGAVRRWHLHAAAPDYFTPEQLMQIPEGDRILVKGYIPNGCDGESIGYPRCAAALEAWCRANNGDRYDCQQHPEIGRVVIELYDWAVVHQQPGACPSGAGAGFVPSPQPAPTPTPAATPAPSPVATPPPPADPCRQHGLCMDMFGGCSSCGGGSPIPVPTPVTTPTPAPSPTPIPATTPATTTPPVQPPCSLAMCPPARACAPCPQCLPPVQGERIPMAVQATIKKGLGALGRQWKVPVADALKWLNDHPLFVPSDSRSTGNVGQLYLDDCDGDCRGAQMDECAP